MLQIIGPAITQGAELGYAERTSDDTTTNGTIGNASLVGNRMSGLAVTVVGTGKPVDIEFWCAGVRNSTGSNYAGAVLLQNGVQITAGTVLSTSTSVGQIMTLKIRKTLTANTSYTFEVGKYGQGGTTTYIGNATFPMYLAVTSR